MHAVEGSLALLPAVFQGNFRHDVGPASPIAPRTYAASALFRSHRRKHFPLQRRRRPRIQTLAHQHGIALLLDHHRAFLGRPRVPPLQWNHLEHVVFRWRILRPRRISPRFCPIRFSRPGFPRRRRSRTRPPPPPPPPIPLLLPLRQRPRINSRKLRSLLRARPPRHIEQPQRRGLILLNPRRIVVSAAPLRIQPLRQFLIRILLDQHRHIELAHRANIELLVVPEVLFEVRHVHGLNPFS